MKEKKVGGQESPLYIHPDLVVGALNKRRVHDETPTVSRMFE